MIGWASWTALLFAAKREAPGRHQFFHRAGVQLGPRAETLARAHAIRHHVARVLASLRISWSFTAARASGRSGRRKPSGCRWPVASHCAQNVFISPVLHFVNWVSLARKKSRPSDCGEQHCLRLFDQSREVQKNKVWRRQAGITSHVDNPGSLRRTPQGKSRSESPSFHGRLPRSWRR